MTGRTSLSIASQQDCLQPIHDILRLEKQLVLKIVRDNLFFNNIRIQMKADKYAILRAFLLEMRKRWIGELEFMEGVEVENLEGFCSISSSDWRIMWRATYLYMKKQFETRGLRAFNRWETWRLTRMRRSMSILKTGRAIFQKRFILSRSILSKSDGGVKSQKMLQYRKAKRLMQNAGQGHHSG